VESLRGKLLIAAPALLDPNFHRTVVLIAAHDEQGAMGLVLNRPSASSVVDLLPSLLVLAEPDAVVHIGGPVAPEAAILLAEFSDPDLAALTIFGDVGLPAADAGIDELAAGVRRARVFAGHSGWGPGQLDAEL
jgi:putative transcriptional regulator